MGAFLVALGLLLGLSVLIAAFVFAVQSVKGVMACLVCLEFRMAGKFVVRALVALIVCAWIVSTPFRLLSADDVQPQVRTEFFGLDS